MRAIALTTLFILLSTVMFARSAYRIDGNNVIIDLDGMGVKSKVIVVELWSASTVRVITTMSDQISETTNLLGERNLSPIKFRAIYVQNDIEISTSKLLITVKENGLVSLLNRDGRKMMIESDRAYEPSTVEEGAFKITQKFFMNRKEFLYGFGHDGLNTRYNIRDSKFDLAHNNIATFSPVSFSESGFAFIWNNYSATEYTEASTVMTLTSEVADEISYFFIYEDNWDALINETRKLFGNASLLPKWAYGFHLNPNAYNTEQDFNTAVDKYRALGLSVEDKAADQQLLQQEKDINAQITSTKYTNAEAFKTLQASYVSLTDASTETRPFVVTHTNIPGIQRYGLVSVAGDIESTWKALNAQVSACITSSFTGQPYWSTTLGGVTQNAALSEQSHNELLTRWYQFAAFTPIFQGGINTEIWQVGSPESPYFKAIANSIDLRYRLMSYVYSTAYDAVANNKAIIKSLVFDFKDDNNILPIDQQYLFGQSFMVCPVTQQGANTLKVQLPANTVWYDFWTGRKLDGGQALTQSVSIDNIPLFVKAGSIIPIITSLPDTVENALQPIEIRVYTGADAKFVFFEDAGDGFAYREGQFTKLSFEYNEKSRTLSIGTPEGTHHGNAIEKLFRIVAVSDNMGIGSTAASEFQEIHYKGKRTKVKL